MKKIIEIKEKNGVISLKNNMSICNGFEGWDW